MKYSSESVFTKTDIFVRYEPDIDDGVLFIFNKQNGEIYEGNESVWNVISQVDGLTSARKIVAKIACTYNIPESCELLNSILDIMTELESKGILRQIDGL